MSEETNEQLRAEVERLKREIDVNERAMDSLIEDAQKLAENEKLRNELDCQSHGICSDKGHGINSTCRYCADEEIERLKKENESFSKIIDDYGITEKHLDSDISKLKSKLDRAKEALKWYRDLPWKEWEPKDSKFVPPGHQWRHIAEEALKELGE